MHKTADLNRLLNEALTKAITPYKSDLRKALEAEKVKLAEVDRFSPERAEADFFVIHGKACEGDPDAKAQLEAMPWPDLKSFAHRYRVLADANWQAVESHRKSYRPTLVAAVEKMLEATKATADTAQKQLDAFCEATGEPAQQSQWAKHRAGEVINLCTAIIEDRAEQDARFVFDLVK